MSNIPDIPIDNRFSEISEARSSIEEAQREVAINSSISSRNIETISIESIARNRRARRSPAPDFEQISSFTDDISQGIIRNNTQIEETFSNYIETSLETIYGDGNESSIVENNIIEEISTLSYVVNSDLKEDSLKNIKRNGSLDIASIIFQNIDNIPDNVFSFYNSITNKSISSVQTISHINPKNKLVTNQIFKLQIKEPNNKITEEYYNKVEIQAKKMFSRIPKIVEFVDSKITDKFRKTDTYLDSIKFGIEKFEDFSKKNNYANIVERYFNENSTSKYLGKIYKESSFDQSLVNSFIQGVNNNISSTQDQDLNLNEFFGKGTAISNVTKSSLIITDFKNKNDDILDTDSFIAQQYANLSCSLFTYYPSLFKNNLLIYNITIPTNTQKLDSKSPKVCIDVENNRDKNIYSYINSENVSLNQTSLIKDTMSYTESVNSFEKCIDKDFILDSGTNISILDNTERNRIRSIDLDINTLSTQLFIDFTDFDDHFIRFEEVIASKSDSDLVNLNARKTFSDIFSSYIYENFINSISIQNQDIFSNFYKTFKSYIMYYLDNNKEEFIEGSNSIDLDTFKFFKNIIQKVINSNEDEEIYNFNIQNLSSNNSLYKENISFLLIKYLIENNDIINLSSNEIKNNINSLNNDLNYRNRNHVNPDMNEMIENNQNIIEFNENIILNKFLENKNFKDYIFSPLKPTGFKNLYKDYINGISRLEFTPWMIGSNADSLARQDELIRVFLNRDKILEMTKNYIKTVYVMKEITRKTLILLLRKFNIFNNKVQNMISMDLNRDSRSFSDLSIDILKILNRQSNENFFLTGNKNLDVELKSKSLTILKELISGTSNFINQENKRNYDFLSKDNLSLNSNKLLINSDYFIKKLKLSYLKKHNVNIELFLNTCKSLKEKSGNSYLATSSDSSNSNSFIYREDLLFKEFYKSEDEKYYSYYNFFNCKVQNDLNIFNTNFILNNELEDSSYDEKYNKFHSLIKNYYFKNVFKNTSTYLLSNIKNTNRYFNQTILENNKNDMILQYLYFCCFENEISSANIEKKSIVKRFLEKSVTRLLGINDTSFKFSINDVVKSDFEEEDGSFNKEKYNKEILDSNEEYKKLINSIFNFNENIAKSTEVFRLYNLRPLLLNINKENSEEFSSNNITITEDFNFDNQLRNEGIAINNFIDIEYYTFPFKKLTREYVATYNINNNFFKLINIRKRFETVFDEEGNPLLLVKEKFNHVPIKEKSNNDTNSKYIISSVNSVHYSHSEKITDNFNEICEKEGTLFNLIIKQIILTIESIKSDDLSSVNDIQDVNNFIENNKDLYFFGEKIIENISDIYNIIFRRVELSSYNNSLPDTNTIEQLDLPEISFENELKIENILEDITKFGNINNEEKINLHPAKIYDTSKSESYLNKNELFKERSDQFLVHKDGEVLSFSTNNFIENQIIKAAISDQLQSLTFDMISGYYLNQKEFYENNLKEEFKNSEFEFLKNELLLGDEIYENISNTSYKRNIYKEISRIMYENKSLYKNFVKNKTDIHTYYKDNINKFFSSLKSDSNYINSIIKYLDQEAYNKNILTVGIPNNLIDRIDNNIALSVNIDFVNHEKTSVSSKEIKFIPTLNNLISNYYNQDIYKNEYNGFISIFNENNKEIKERYSIVNTSGIDNTFISDISKNHIDSFSYKNIFNVAYNNSIKEDLFFIDENYNSRLIDIDFYNLILSLRERDFNLISDIDKDIFEENISIVDDKYVKIPDLSYCISNNINIYNTLYEINKNISNIKFDKMFKEKLFYEIYFIPIDRENNDGITL